MSQELLKNNEKVFLHLILPHLTIDEINSESDHIERKEFDDKKSVLTVNPCPLPRFYLIERMISTYLTLKRTLEDITKIPEEYSVESTVKAIYNNPFTDMLIHE